jgi:hypothetical protein
MLGSLLTVFLVLHGLWYYAGMVYVLALGFFYVYLLGLSDL